MPSSKRPKNAWVLAAIFVAVAAITVVLEVTGPREGALLSSAIRGLALMGYQLLFLSMLSSAYMPNLVRFFGTPFIKIHHVLSISGLVFMTAHPLLVAIRNGSAEVFLPQFDSVRVFLALGGRPAWYLIAVAVAAALLRRRIGKGWRIVHLLNYLAFALATAHATLLGANFQTWIPRIVSWAMLIAVLAVFAHKRLPAAKTARKPVPQ
jgi:DMSO/TMAO reductase YedYZ heme-binding membrane subunit